mmetsp:Transcript_46394/g.73784  ORF Transcript_46394/g.73784 Transcript_46394/m.73784 type:complete len:85 (-) Transcript_46394:307-561(-)
MVSDKCGDPDWTAMSHAGSHQTKMRLHGYSGDFHRAGKFEPLPQRATQTLLSGSPHSKSVTGKTKLKTMNRSQQRMIRGGKNIN